jgi:hypothetical protein
MAAPAINLEAAINRGELTQDELRELIRHEAAGIGLTCAQAVQKVRRGTLRRTVAGRSFRGASLELLVSMLDE